MNHRSSFSIVFLIGVSFSLVVLYIVLSLLKIQAGTMIDWAVGLAAFWWLTGITTLPWDMYFAAKDLLHEAKISENKKITLDEADLEYARKKAKIFAYIAIILHIVTAASLYLLAYFEISSIGYFAAGIAIVLTFVRPAYRLYDYIIQRLYSMRNKILYPREDVYEIRQTLTQQTERIDQLVALLDFSEKNSWGTKIAAEVYNISAHSNHVEEKLEVLRKENDKAHVDLSTKTQQEIAKLSEDAQFLNQIRDLVKFIKNA